MNLGAIAINKKVITWAFTLVLLIGGLQVYDQLPRLEDPEFTIKQATIETSYPGASAAEVEEEVTDVIERACQELGQLKFVESWSYRGKSVVQVNIKDNYDKTTLPQVWDELRNKVGDYQGQLPPGAGPSVVFDSFGDVYGVYVVLTGEGYSMAEIKETAKMLRRQLLQATDVKKITFWGERNETVYVEMSRDKMATLGVSRDAIFEALIAKNLPVDSGRVKLMPEYVVVNPTGEFSMEEFGEILVAGQDGRLLRLKDVASISRGFIDPPSTIMRFNGQRGIALGISTVMGGNVVSMGESIQKKLTQVESLIPVGMDIGIVSMQSEAVTIAINSFVQNLMEAVLIVVVVLLLFMGLRSGLIIGFVLFLTIAGTFLVMGYLNITLERISLGALIIALGMLVDNAIVVVDGMKVRFERGMDRLEAAKEVVGKNMIPLAGGTLVAILAFAGIGTTPDQTGEYCRSLFTVIWISLGMSWITAVTTTPLLAFLLLPRPKKTTETTEKKPAKESILIRGYRSLLVVSLRQRYVTMAVVVSLFVVALFSFGQVKQMFFPDSSRPQFFVDFFFAQGQHIEATEAQMKQVEEYFRAQEGTTDIASAVGGGDTRFLLTYSPNPTSTSFGVVFVSVEDAKAIPDILARAQVDLEEMLPDAVINTRPFRLGPGEGGRIQLRISGDDRAELRRMGETVLQIMTAEGAQGVRSEWREKEKVIRPVLAEAQAQQLGITRPMVGQLIQSSFDGYQTGVYREGTELLPIVARAPQSERMSVDNLNDLQIFSPTADRTVPLRQLLTGFETTFEDPIIYRRDRWTTIRFHCDPAGELPSELMARIKPQIEQALGVDLAAYTGDPDAEADLKQYDAATLPILYRDQIPLKDRPGYFIAWGGEDEESALATGNLAKVLPVFGLLMVLTVVALFSNVRRTAIIWLTVPLSLIGVTLGLLLFNQPFGFMALLGFLSLSGMIIKNSIVLIEEIVDQMKSGKQPFEAVVAAGLERMMPVLMAALTTILGMIPLIPDAFFAAMAVTIMMGLAVATFLTLVVVPTLYVILFKIKEA